MNEPIKCQEFEQKLERKRTPNFCFCLPYCKQQCQGQNKVNSEIFSQCECNSTHNVEGKSKYRVLIVQKLVEMEQETTKVFYGNPLGQAYNTYCWNSLCQN